MTAAPLVAADVASRALSGFAHALIVPVHILAVLVLAVLAFEGRQARPPRDGGASGPAHLPCRTSRPVRWRPPTMLPASHGRRPGHSPSTVVLDPRRGVRFGSSRRVRGCPRPLRAAHPASPRPDPDSRPLGAGPRADGHADPAQRPGCPLSATATTRPGRRPQDRVRGHRSRDPGRHRRLRADARTHAALTHRGPRGPGTSNRVARLVSRIGLGRHGQLDSDVGDPLDGLSTSSTWASCSPWPSSSPGLPSARHEQSTAGRPRGRRIHSTSRTRLSAPAARASRSDRSIGYPMGASSSSSRALHEARRPFPRV